VVLQYGQQPGYAPLREELAKEYGVSPDQILVGNGSLQLQDLVAAHLVSPGAVVYTEQPSYDRAILTFRRRGARTLGIPLEDDGISVERLEVALRREVPAFVYLVPDFQNPAGATLSEEKRRRVVELADEYGFWVIEDIPYRKLRYEGRGSADAEGASSLARNHYELVQQAALPRHSGGVHDRPEDLAKPVTHLGEDTYLSPVLPTQAAVAEYLRRGLLQPNIERLKELYKPRWRAMAGAVRTELPDAQAFIPLGGFFVSVMLPEGANTDGLVARAKDAGLVLTAGAAFFADPRRR
jgi:DNA-binding transcriptional MocR family regulator